VLARTDDQTIKPRHEPFDLSVVVAEAIETEGAALGRRPDEVRLAPDLVVDADADEVGQIVRNLVENAFVHGGDGVRVRVATTGSEREAVVEVEDDGPGIPAAERARVFEPFYRSRRDASAPSGSGLGLAIAADLAKRNGGRLTVDAGRPAGVVARLMLPRFR
jgi:two-component system sensor histidine kinase TctE